MTRAGLWKQIQRRGNVDKLKAENEELKETVACLRENESHYSKEIKDKGEKIEMYYRLYKELKNELNTIKEQNKKNLETRADRIDYLKQKLGELHRYCPEPNEKTDKNFAAYNKLFSEVKFILNEKEDWEE